MGVITAKQSRYILRGIGRELRPLWDNQVFALVSEAAKYQIQEAIARAIRRLENNDIARIEDV